MIAGAFQNHTSPSSDIGAQIPMVTGASPSHSLTWTAGLSPNAQAFITTEMFRSQTLPSLAIGVQKSTIDETSPCHSQTWTARPSLNAGTFMTSGSEDPTLFSLSCANLQELLVEDELMTTFTSQVGFNF